MPSDRCAWLKCAATPAVGWLGKPLCERHWETVCGLTATGRGGFLKAYATLKVPRRFWAAGVSKPDGAPDGEGYGDLPNPDEFDYAP